MKKNILTMFAMLVFATSFAQTFNGMIIGGTMAQMRFKLEAKGFKLDEIKSNIIWMKGKMANKNVLVGVVGTPKTKTVWKVVAIFDSQESWSSLKSEYTDMKTIFIKKYGEPTDCFAFFKDPYYEGDGYELSAISKGNASFSCFWENIEDGKMNVSVEIGKSQSVVLHYENIKLTQVKNKEQEELEQSAF